ncbi:MAG: hypothetical protein GX802_06550 [Clostridiales bacterium]|nr:hypothetical protein [Clostridiales bacterium]
MFKKITLLSLLLIIIFLFGCQPTPDEPIVISKGDGKLQDALNSTPIQEKTKYTAPQNWTETLSDSDSKVTIEIDACITVPDADAYPVYHVENCEISDMQFNAILSYFIGNEKIYTWNPEVEDAVSETIIRKRIDAIEYQLYDSTSMYNKYVISDDSIYSQAEQKIAQESLLGTLAECNARLGNFHGNTWQEIPRAMQTTDTNGIIAKTYDCNHSILMRRTFDLLSQSVLCTNNTYAIELTKKYANIETKPFGVKSKISELKQKADEAVIKCGFDDYKIAKIGKAVPACEDNMIDWIYMWGGMSANDGEYDDIWTPIEKKPGCYYFIYTPEYEGIPLLYYCNNDSQNIPIDAQKYIMNKIDHQPSLHVAVDDNGIISIELQNGIQLKDTVNSNVRLMPFDEIKEIARRYFVLKPNLSYVFDRNDMNADANHEKTVIHIEDIRLGYMRNLELNSNNDLLLPVWFFYGTQHDYYYAQEAGSWKLNENNERVIDTPIGHAFLIINAIDGSIIDPFSGY